MSYLLLAVDIGNSGIHLSPYSESLLPTDQQDGVLELDELTQLDRLQELSPTLTQLLAQQPASWFVASVNRGFERQLSAWVARNRLGDNYYLLSHRDFELTTDVLYPERVGHDRLAAAVAANARRSADSGAIIVDAGTAITVDYVDPRGVFRGGAILPGPHIAGRALADFTDALPRVELPESPPEPLGKETRSAIESGLYWGTLGGVRELVARIRSQADASTDLFLTGGAAKHDHFLAALPGQFIPHMTLDGIALAGRRLLAKL
jgi:type III pantothenate kinase